MDDTIVCPLCGGKAIPKVDEPYKGLYRCGRCGAIKFGEQWLRVCPACGKRVEKLYGYMVPHLCATCFEAKKAEQRAEGYVCSRCGEPRIACPH